MKKNVLFLILLIVILVLSGCYKTEDVKKLIANEVTQVMYVTQMESSEALFSLMKENEYQTSNFKEFIFIENKLSFILNEDVSYKKTIDANPTTLTVEISGPVEKKKEMIELTFFSYNKEENGEKVISKKTINELIEESIKTNKKQEFLIKTNDKEINKLGFVQQLTLEVETENNITTIVAKGTFEYKK